MSTEPNTRTWTFPDARPPGDGPWTAEPDKAQWVDPQTGLDCLIVRNRGGAMCGYVGLPPGHPLYGVDYDTVHERADIDVHGGLTFASLCRSGAEDGWGVCHVPEPGRPERVWWLGFDCAHAGDLSPRYEFDLPAYSHAIPRGVYRDMAYVRDQVTALAAQLAPLGDYLDGEVIDEAPTGDGSDTDWPPAAEPGSGGAP